MKEILKPVLVLGLICLVVTALLAFVNEKTAPVIRDAEENNASAARSEVLSEAKAFEKMSIAQLPEGVSDVYQGKNKKGEVCGYVIRMQAKGYGGPVKMIAGLHADGSIAAVRTLSHAETNGVGTKAVDNNAGYYEKFKGLSGQAYQKVDTVSGATISSTACKKGIGLAMEAYGRIKEAEHENAE